MQANVDDVVWCGGLASEMEGFNHHSPVHHQCPVTSPRCSLIEENPSNALGIPPVHTRTCGEDEARQVGFEGR
jgi:hypothetical protein